MIRSGSPELLGASPDSQGTNFSLHCSAAERVELCLYDASGRETARMDMPERSADIWHGYLPGCRPGQRYGYRVHGRYAPAEGLRFNASKLLLDPYARLLDGEFTWSPAVFDFIPEKAGEELLFNAADSGPFVPKSVVVDSSAIRAANRPAVPWSEMLIYELNVRGFSMQHPEIPERERGRFSGLRNGRILEYLKALGITSVELMPVQAFIDEHALQQRGLRNLWGYNTINFFAPANRYLGEEGTAGFRAMVDAIHDAGIEVILDIAYNHSGESDYFGPTLSFRGIDNLAYYRTLPGNPGEYINDTGCGNTLDADSPVVRRMVLDSLRYWSREMGVDGFRFDLAPVLGRSQSGFSGQHPLLQAIATDPALAALKLIAEPWDPGPGGYQLGNFGARWSEWNDRYRDSVRRFWRGDEGQSAELAQRLHGSADIFEPGGRGPAASINFVSSHDGFTLADTVAYEQRHNMANGENNRDGHQHNYSHNHGVEGATTDTVILALRRQQRLNILATLLFSNGIPMLLAGDEFGNSQDGNNNAYAQDNFTGWLNWSGVNADPDFLQSVRDLVRLRRKAPLLRRVQYPHGHIRSAGGCPDIDWRRPDGSPLSPEDWQSTAALVMLLTETGQPSEYADQSIAILINRAGYMTEFILPNSDSNSDAVLSWQLLFSSCTASPQKLTDSVWHLEPVSIACLSLRPTILA